MLLDAEHGRNGRGGYLEGADPAGYGAGGQRTRAGEGTQRAIGGLQGLCGRGDRDKPGCPCAAPGGRLDAGGGLLLFGGGIEGGRMGAALPGLGENQPACGAPGGSACGRGGGQAAATDVYLQGRASVLHAAVLHRLSVRGYALQRNPCRRVSGGELGRGLLVGQPVLRPGHPHQRRYPAP